MVKLATTKYVLTTAAHLTLTSVKHKVVETISINNRGTGQLLLNTAGLPSGMYTLIGKPLLTY